MEGVGGSGFWAGAAMEGQASVTGAVREELSRQRWQLSCLVTFFSSFFCFKLFERSLRLQSITIPSGFLCYACISH